MTIFDFAINLFKHGINRRFGCSPLLNHDYQNLFKILEYLGKSSTKEEYSFKF